jgi:hypothetical protein
MTLNNIFSAFVLNNETTHPPVFQNSCDLGTSKRCRIGVIQVVKLWWTMPTNPTSLAYRLLLHFTPGRSLPLIFCIHVRSGPIYWGGYLPCKKYYKVMVFTCKNPENIICDGILHVNMFHYFKIPYFTCNFLQNLPTMNILDPIFYRTLFYDFRLVISPGILHRKQSI